MFLTFSENISLLLSTSEFWETIEFICMWAVLVGVICEGIKYVPFIKLHRKWARKIEAIGFIILVIGLAGEIPAGRELLIAARDENEDLRVIAEVAKEGASKAEERTAKMNLEVIKLKLELKKLKTPRGFSDKERAILLDSLKNFPAQKFELRFVDDDEAVQFGLKICEILKLSGWEQINSGAKFTRNINGKDVGSVPVFTGIILGGVRADIASHKAFLTLKNAFESMEIEIRTSDGLMEQNSNAITIVIGKKPL